MYPAAEMSLCSYSDFIVSTEKIKKRSKNTTPDRFVFF